MNLRTVSKLLGFVLCALAFAFVCAALVGLVMEDTVGPAAFAISGAVAMALAGAAFAFGRRSSNTLFGREALGSIGIAWLLASAVGALPYWLILPQLSWTDALFESASGLTTTGASVLSDLETLPASLHFWRCFSQWLGGLGVVVFFVAILSFLGAGAKILYSRESSANAADLGTARIQSGVLRLLLFYLGLSAACTVAFMFCGLSFFEALLHMFTTVSTGGFSTRSASIAAFSSPALEWTVTAFMVLGGTSFILMLEVFRGRPRALLQSTEFIAYISIILSATAVVAAFLLLDPSSEIQAVEEAARAAAFQVVSILTTTGFATADFNQWLPVSHVILLCLMVIGGCAGSTSGGTKVVRFVTASKIAIQQIEKSYRRHVVRPIRVNGKAVPPEDQQSTLVFFMLLALVLISSTLLVALLEPDVSLEGTVSAVAACLFNIGPGLAEVGPTENFAAFGDLTKLLLAFIMIMGRLELFAILALFSPSLWKS